MTCEFDFAVPVALSKGETHRKELATNGQSSGLPDDVAVVLVDFDIGFIRW